MKPILFNTQMVQAILAGRKTQTRRIVKPQPQSYSFDGRVYIFDEGELPKPQYQPGDILYVRETWTNLNTEENPCFFYKATDEMPEWSLDKHWRPSIHMPREAARLFLRVTDVRVERLWDISSEDVYAEGTDNRLWAATRDAFRRLWDSTIKKADLYRYGWAANPWVWVFEFERITREEAEAALKEGNPEGGADG